LTVEEVPSLERSSSWPLLEQQHRRRLKKSWQIDLIYYLMAPTRATTQKKVKEILASRPNWWLKRSPHYPYFSYFASEDCHV
jgi:hypothetical protein